MLLRQNRVENEPHGSSVLLADKTNLETEHAWLFRGTTRRPGQMEQI
jgi:hypothetical protein